MPSAVHALENIACWQYRQEDWHSIQDTIAPEQEVSLYWHDQLAASLLAFPSGLSSLCLGHAWLELCRPGETPGLDAQQGESFYLSVRNARKDLDLHAPEPQLTPEATLALRNDFMRRPGKWDHTGCFHRAGVYDPQEHRFLTTTEDIGRHNCLDRLAGWSLTENVNLRTTVLMVTARATASLVEKAVRAGFPILVSQSAVTTLAVDKAQQAGLTLVGFVREHRLTVFTDPHHRILRDAGS